MGNTVAKTKQGIFYVCLINGNEYLVHTDATMADAPGSVSKLWGTLLHGKKPFRPETVEFSEIPDGMTEAEREDWIAPSGRTPFADIPVFPSVSDFIGHWVGLR